MISKTLLAAKLLMVALVSYALARAAAGEDKFDIPAPSTLNNTFRLNLWSTYYYVSSAKALPVEQPFKLLGKQGKVLGVSLAAKDWCIAAVEGTVSVLADQSVARTFNYAGLGGRQVDCLRFFPSLKPAIGNSLFHEVPADAPFGLGDTSKFRLVPYRSIAVDRSQPAFRLKSGAQIRKVAVYIPGLRGIKIKMPDGQLREHDGYVFAADTGGAIKGNHVDFFLGVEHTNPDPRLIMSKATPTFAAYFVEDVAIREALYKLHERNDP